MQVKRTHESIASRSSSLQRGQLLEEELLEPLHAFGLQRDGHRDTAALAVAGAVQQVHEPRVVHERRRQQRRLSPPEVRVVGRHPQPADHAQVRAGESTARQRRQVGRLQVVQQRPRVLVPVPRRRAEPTRAETQRVGQEVADDGGHGGARHRVAEEGVRQRRRQAGAHVHHRVEPGLGVGSQRARRARAPPDVRHQRAEGGHRARAGTERGGLRAGHAEDRAGVLRRLVVASCRRWPGGAAAVLVGVVEEDRRQWARPEGRAVKRRGHGGGGGVSTGDAGPRPDEVEGAAAVDDEGVHGRAERHAAAPEEGDLRVEETGA